MSSVAASVTGERAATARVSGRVVSWGVFAVFTAFTLWFTWPLVLDLQGSFYGGPGDLTGGMATLRELVQGPQNPFLPGHLMDFGAPEGTPIAWTVNVGTFSSTLPMWLIAVAGGPVLAFNLLMITGFIATAQATFLLARRLTASAGAAFIAGWAYAFFPFMVINSRGHTYFIHGWAFVLILWRMLELAERPTRRNGLLAGAAAVVAFAWNPYFLLIGGTLFFTLVCVQFVRGAIARELRHNVAALAWAVVPVGAFAVLIQYVTSTAEVPGTRNQTLDALTVYSARPFEYVVPHGASALFGDMTRTWLQNRIHGSNGSEATLYVGVSIIVLAIIGVAVVQLRRLRLPAARVTTVTLIVVAVVAFAFSAPPYVDLPLIGVQVKTPAYVVHAFIPSWRVYSRFVLVVMLALVLLAAYGITWLARRRSAAATMAVLGVILAVVAVDLWEQRDPAWVTKINPQPVYAVLKKQPPGLVAEYPMEPFGFGDYSAEFYQQDHGKRIVNGFGERSPQEWRATSLVRLDDPRAVRRLATLGVRYVVNTHVPIQDGVTPPGKPGAGLKQIADSPYATLYRVTARPLPAVIIGGEGFEPPEGPIDRQTQWLSGDRGELEVRAACRSCAADLQFVAGSLGKDRRLMTVRDERGRVLLRAPVAPLGTRVRVPVKIVDHHASVWLSATPGPKKIADVVGGGDQRRVSLLVRATRLVPRRGS